MKKYNVKLKRKDMTLRMVFTGNFITLLLFKYKMRKWEIVSVTKEV